MWVPLRCNRNANFTEKCCNEMCQLSVVACYQLTDNLGRNHRTNRLPAGLGSPVAAGAEAATGSAHTPREYTLRRQRRAAFSGGATPASSCCIRSSAVLHGEGI